MGWAIGHCHSEVRYELEEKSGRYRLQCERIMIIGPYKDNKRPLYEGIGPASLLLVSQYDHSRPPTKNVCAFDTAVVIIDVPNPTYFTHKQMTALEIILVLPTQIAKPCELRKKMAHFEMGLFMLLGIYWLCRRCTAVFAL